MNLRARIIIISLVTILLVNITIAEENKLQADSKRRPTNSGGSQSTSLGQNFLSSFTGGGLSNLLGGGQGLLGSLGSGQGLLSSFGDQGFLSSFAHSRLNEVMSTATGILAAIGGGYLVYVASVALYGNVLGRPYGIRRESSDLLRQVKAIDYPEAVFNWLQIKDESCKMKAVCELQAFLSGNIPSVVLESVSNKIPGMKKYQAASRRGIRKQNCNTQCNLTTGEMMMKAMGSWIHFT